MSTFVIQYEYIIEKRDGKFICVNSDNQEIKYVITKIPEQHFGYIDDHSIIKYNGFTFKVSIFYFGGPKHRPLKSCGVTSIALERVPNKDYLKYLHEKYIELQWDLDIGKAGEWYAYMCKCGGCREGVLTKDQNMDCSFDDLMQIIVKTYPFIDDEAA